MKPTKKKKSLNKKAQLEHKLVSIILIALTLLILIGVIQRGFSKFQGKDAEIVCQESLAARAALAVQTGDAELKTLPLLCKTLDKDISGTAEEVKEQLARSMARCWWMFGEGRYDEVVSSGFYPLRVLGFEGSENACFLCYSVVVPQEGLEEGPISKRDMFRYVSNELHPQVPDTTYLDYIQNYGGPGNVLVGSDIAAGEAYGIVFVAKGATGGALGDIQNSVQSALAELGLFSEGVNTDTSTIVLNRLSAINEQYGCESDIAGR
ncbi:MAG TPA: hypothetical protein VJC21_02745 [Candidatus Nanoarchaeia archaeon]|nr:hypothetical protein [Candidatus Nanoarchaeia archaeon]